MIHDKIMNHCQYKRFYHRVVTNRCVQQYACAYPCWSRRPADSADTGADGARPRGRLPAAYSCRAHTSPTRSNRRMRISSLYIQISYICEVETLLIFINLLAFHPMSNLNICSSLTMLSHMFPIVGAVPEATSASGARIGSLLSVRQTVLTQRRQVVEPFVALTACILFLF